MWSALATNDVDLATAFFTSFSGDATPARSASSRAEQSREPPRRWSAFATYDVDATTAFFTSFSGASTPARSASSWAEQSSDPPRRRSAASKAASLRSVVINVAFDAEMASTTAARGFSMPHASPSSRAAQSREPPRLTPSVLATTPATVFSGSLMPARSASSRASTCKLPPLTPSRGPERMAVAEARRPKRANRQRSAILSAEKFAVRGRRGRVRGGGPGGVGAGPCGENRAAQCFG
mmetsp:Transcript_1697/g.5013  ORF Transcript_1697/g.5013 Transcript_1697/m.5013 type:complete len:238 (-) Transcript_1697:2-715(-)